MMNYRKLALLLLLLLSTAAVASAEYTIDTKGMHAFITFKIKHLGYSWLLGRFNRFEGTYQYDEDEKHPERSRVEVEIDVASLDTNHAERDKHLRSKRFFDVKKYPTARFVSTAFEPRGGGKALLKGEFTLRGITRNIVIDVQQVGAGPDPWGGYRRGFEGQVVLNLSDYQMAEANILGDAAEKIEIYLSIEGVRKKSGRAGKRR